MNPKVDFYFNKEKQWQKEIMKLRSIVNECHLKEELKWGAPCYTYEGDNIVLIHVFKEYCALLFMKGALLKDPKKILIRQTENVQAARQIRFTSLEEITGLESVIKKYIFEAVKIQEAGLKVPVKKVSEYEIPEEFSNKLKKMPSLKTAFQKLTPGRQKAYLLFFSSAKQAKTREARVEKYIDHILEGKGMDDE
jgi:uncharacterized protein YdeI (YjbR/CyaY-like superfamily)